jgi:hypothetical protein
MTDFDRPFENLSPDDDRVNVWVKIIAIAGVIASAVMVYMDLQDKVGSWR